VSQYELGQTRPSLEVIGRIALSLGVPAEFFLAGHPVATGDATAAHFRSLRATTQLERDQAVAFGELSWQLISTLEAFVDLPKVRLPQPIVPSNLSRDEIQKIAQQARVAFGLASGPVAHMVRLLEVHGVIVLRLPQASLKVDAFSYWCKSRPLVFLSPAKNDKPRSRFDVAHELGHLLLHYDAEPGSRVVENQAHDFAAEFLAPKAEIACDLPARLDWERLHQLKRRWGISLKALIFRSHALGIMSDYWYRRAMISLAEWGDPEPGPLGPPESPMLVGRALTLAGEVGQSLESISRSAGLPVSLSEAVVAAGSEHMSKLPLLPDA
jgi:Zn-dependent peptidase ImmA (M78 family)